MKLIVAVLILLAGFWLTPWSQPRAMITVTGEARQQIKNQIARFSVSVTQTDKDKQTAVETVNAEMDKIIQAVKAFGIEAKDLTTQNVSVYEVNQSVQVGQPEILIYPPRPDVPPMEKQWQAGNSLEVILRDAGRASALTDLLEGFSLAQVSGPRFSLDNEANNEAEFLTQAVEDAREKAAKVAAASGRKLGKVLAVTEGFSSQPWPMYRELAVGDKARTPAPIEPGSSQISKTVTVVFELK